MKRSWKQILFLTIAPKSKEDFTPVSKISWFKISLWIMLLIGIFFLISDQSTILPNPGNGLTEDNFQDTVATTAPADTMPPDTVSVVIPTVADTVATDSAVVAQDSSTVTPPDSSTIAEKILQGQKNNKKRINALREKK